MSSKRYNKEYYQKNRAKLLSTKHKYVKELGKDLIKNRKLKYIYGITLSQYQIILELQNGKCAICNKIQDKRPLSVDHDHTTGKIRGLLCLKCNSGIGFVSEDVNILESMISYIKKHLI